MKDSDSRRSSRRTFHTVSDPVQARLLSDPESLRFFFPFLAAEQTVTGAAQEVGCRLHAMLYRVRRFLDAGLLRVVREEKRPGRSVKIYRSAHDAYFIPLSATPYADLEERLREQLGPLTDDLIRGFASVLREVGYSGRRLYREADGFVSTESGEEFQFGLEFDNPDWPVVYDFDHQLYLTHAEAKALQRELRDLHARYRSNRMASEGEKYLLHVALVPQPES